MNDNSTLNSDLNTDCICGRELGICDAHEQRVINWRDLNGTTRTNHLGEK